MATVHSYARFSDKSQELGTSAERQDKGLAEFIRDGKHTLSNLKPFWDKGRSGFNGNKQKALEEFLKVLRAKDGRINPGDILFVEAVDRLSRKGIRKTQDTVNEILNAGVSIAINIPLKKVYRAEATNELGDAIELAAFAWTAHVYSDLLSKRVKGFHAWARNQAIKDKTPINSGHTPYWVERKDGKFRLIPEAAEAIRYIFQRTIDGIGAKILGKELNAEFPAIGRSGVWNEQYIRMILNDRRVIGEYQPHEQDENGKRVPIGDPIPNYYPAVVDEKTMIAANQSTANRRKEKGPSKEFINLFTGIVYHAIDKCPVHIYSYQQRRADGRKVTFRRLKSVYATDGVPGASTETVDIFPFEKFLLGKLREIDLSVFNEGNSKALELKATIHALEKKTAKLKELEQAAKQDDSDNLAFLLGAMGEKREEIKVLKEKIDSLKARDIHSGADTVDHIRVLSQLPNNNETRQKLREAIKRVVQQIVILPVKLGTLRRSPVVCAVEITFHSGARRVYLQDSIQAPVTFSIDKPESPGFMERDRKDLNKVQKAIAALAKSSAN